MRRGHIAVSMLASRSEAFLSLCGNVGGRRLPDPLIREILFRLVRIRLFAVFIEAHRFHVQSRTRTNKLVRYA